MKRQTHNDKVLALLSDGRVHSYREGYRLDVMLHSRVSDLRKKGYAIRVWREGDDYKYQLAGGISPRLGSEARGSVGNDGSPPDSPSPPEPASAPPVGAGSQLTLLLEPRGAYHEAA